MEAIEINTLEECERIYKYCKERLPVLDGFTLEVSQNITVISEGIVPLKGVTLRVMKGQTAVASSTGLDEDDALLDIYKQLLYFFRSHEGKKIIAKPALGKTHFSYE